MALVAIQGKDRGRTMEVIEDVPAGAQTIVLSRPGYGSHSMLVNIKAGKVTVTPKVVLEQIKNPAGTPTATTLPTPAGTNPGYPASGALFIYTVPFGCSLSIDDIPVAMTPGLVTSVPPGTHTVRIALPGYKDACRTVAVHPHDISVVLVMMTPDIRSIGSAFA
jgi:hypothetical protein